MRSIRHKTAGEGDWAEDWGRGGGKNVLRKSIQSREELRAQRRKRVESHRLNENSLDGTKLSCLKCSERMKQREKKKKKKKKTLLDKGGESKAQPVVFEQAGTARNATWAVRFDEKSSWAASRRWQLEAYVGTKMVPADRRRQGEVRIYGWNCLSNRPVVSGEWRRREKNPTARHATKLSTKHGGPRPATETGTRGRTAQGNLP